MAPGTIFTGPFYEDTTPSYGPGLVRKFAYNKRQRRGQRDEPKATFVIVSQVRPFGRRSAIGYAETQTRHPLARNSRL